MLQFPLMNQEVKTVQKIAEWLINNLKSVLPEKVQPDLEKVAISGHSKGGNTAFAVALDSSMPLKFSALLGIDPVAGCSPSCLRPPYVLEYIPRIFNQSIPVAVIGAGLSNQSTCCLLPSGCFVCPDFLIIIVFIYLFLLVTFINEKKKE